MAINDELRQRAETAFRENTALSPAQLEALSPDATRQMLHELGVHQIELEMQNEELRRAQLELDVSRARYFNLYDLAPVGYCTVNDAGQILQANLAAATLLGMTRGELARQSITRFVVKTDQDIYYLRCKQLVKSGKPQSCELRMVTPDGTQFWVHLTMTAAQDPSTGSGQGDAPEFRIVLSDITERRQAERELEESRAQLRGFLVRREAATEEERKYIAREVHDELGQVLTGLQLNVSVIAQKFAADAPALRDYLQQTMKLTNRAIDAVRNVTSALRPAALEMGIVSALEWLAGRFGANQGIQCVVHVEGAEIQLDENHAIALYRIVQESLTNVARHAGASIVEITLIREGDDYVLKVRDNGSGFDSRVKKENSFGLVGIRERALMLAGTVFINSQPGSGTELVVRIPVNNDSRKL